MLSCSRQALARAAAAVSLTSRSFVPTSPVVTLSWPPPESERSAILPFGSVGRKLFVFNAKTKDGVTRIPVLCILGIHGHPIIYLNKQEVKDLMGHMPEIEKAMNAFDVKPPPKPKPPRLFPLRKKPQK